LLAERPEIRFGIYRAILTFFNQASDDVSLVDTPTPLEMYDVSAPLFSFSEIAFRSFGFGVAIFGVVVGTSMMFGSRKSLAHLWNGFLTS
jgi:hypothetical protein